MSILFDGLGNAGQAIVQALCALWFRCQVVAHPVIWLVDNAVWRPHHARGGLVSGQDVGQPKVETALRRLKAGGWPTDRVRAEQTDVRDCPRARYERSVALALTDSHETKALSVERALSVGCPAIAVGLGQIEAVVECFSPSGAGYCCIHRRDEGWLQRHPCMPDGRQVSTTETAGRWATEAAARLVGCLLAGWSSTGDLPGGRGWRVTEQGIDEFSFHRDSCCPGLHDLPVCAANTLSLPATPEQIHIDELLEKLGARARYADRALAWKWRCRSCGERHLLHSVHPAASCAICGVPMTPGFERASGLDVCELRALAVADGLPTLAAMGLAEERLLRCTVDDGVIWVRLKGVE